MKKNCKPTMTACFIGYITQAIVTSFIPLLYLQFQEAYHVDFGKITLIIAVNFTIQLIVDFLASKYVAYIGYRPCLVVAHILCSVGFMLLTILPKMLGYFPGILISVIVYATGAGLLEVLVSPVVESCPTKNKAGIMSFLHSFYCWGVVATVLLSTVFFSVFGIGNWKIIAIIWAMVPLFNAFLFSRVTLYPIDAEKGPKPNYKKLFTQKPFWVLVVIMVCAGACEQILSQWGSTIAELALNTDKVASDLLAVCGFAFMMGLSRLIYAKFSKQITLTKSLFFCALLCIVSFVMIGASSCAAITITGFALCGFSIGIFWPGTFSLAAKIIKSGGTTMFALLALAGDIGCTGGPSLVGAISGMFNESLQSSMIFTVLFPLSMVVALICLKKIGRNSKVIENN